MTDITNETYTGANASGTDGDKNRVLTLSNTEETKQEQFSVYQDGLYLQLNSDYSVSHNTSGTEITFLNALWDNQNIVVNYKLSGSRYITVESVKRVVGINDEISDEDLRDMIIEVESEVSRYFNTEFTPTEQIDILDGNDSLRIFTKKNPLLSVRDLKIDGTTVTIDGNVNIYKPSGMIRLDNTDGTPEKNSFTDKKQAIVVKYIYGKLDESSTDTTLSSDSSVGSSVALTVASETGFSVGNWIEIYGMDGNREVAKITGTGSSQITVDKLVQSHEAESKIVKLEISQTFKRLLNAVAGIMVAVRLIGQTYTVETGYSMGEISIQKGVPYTHWQEVANKLIKERDRLMNILKPRPSIQI